MADPRGRQGLRYEWVYRLTMIAGAVWAGQQSVRAMAQWAAQNADELLASLQPKRGTVPSAATLYRALHLIDPTE